MRLDNSRYDDNSGGAGSSSSSTAPPHQQARGTTGSHTKKNGVQHQHQQGTQTIRIGNVTLRYAYLSQAGMREDDDDDDEDHYGTPGRTKQDAVVVLHRADGGGTQNHREALFLVLDGHGTHGHHVAQYCAAQLPQQLKLYLKDDDNDNKHRPAVALHNAFLATHRLLGQRHDIDDTLSGTTCVAAYFVQNGNVDDSTATAAAAPTLHVANVGDSRVILGQKRQHHGRVLMQAQALTWDHTPHRLDEAARLLAAGARVLSLDQLEGLQEAATMTADNNQYHDYHVTGDVLRVWQPDGDYPGTAVSRSLGDTVAHQWGVTAVPEVLTHAVQSQPVADKILVLATDGVTEFLSDQSIMDLCAKFDAPLDACRAVVAEAYELWWQYERRSDDITVVVVFIEHQHDST